MEYPQANFQSLIKILTLLKDNIYYYFELDKDRLGYCTNDSNMVEFENEGYQSREDMFFSYQERYPLMGKTDIQCETM